MSGLGWSKRVRSPSSAIRITAPVSSTPRRAWIASTTGYKRQLFTCSCSSLSRRPSRSCCSVTARRYPWKTSCWAGVGHTTSASQRRVGGGPGRPALVANVLAQQEGLEPLLGGFEIPEGISTHRRYAVHVGRHARRQRRG